MLGIENFNYDFKINYILEISVLNIILTNYKQDYIV